MTVREKLRVAVEVLGGRQRPVSRAEIVAYFREHFSEVAEGSILPADYCVNLRPGRSWDLRRGFADQTYFLYSVGRGLYQIYDPLAHSLLQERSSPPSYETPTGRTAPAEADRARRSQAAQTARRSKAAAPHAFESYLLLAILFCLVLAGVAAVLSLAVLGFGLAWSAGTPQFVFALAIWVGWFTFLGIRAVRRRHNQRPQPTKPLGPPR